MSGSYTVEEEVKQCCTKGGEKEDPKLANMDEDNTQFIIKKYTYKYM